MILKTLPHRKLKRRKTVQKSTLNYKWCKNVVSQLLQQTLDDTASNLDFVGKSPVEIFELLHEFYCRGVETIRLPRKEWSLAFRCQT